MIEPGLIAPFFAAVAAGFSAFAALSIMRVQKLGVRPVIELKDWTRIDPVLKPDIDRLVFTAIENIGEGAARHLSVTAEALSFKAAVRMAPVFEPILRAGASIQNFNQIVILWNCIDGQPGSKNVQIQLTIQCRDNLNQQITTTQTLQVYEDWSTQLSGRMLAEGVLCGKQTTRIKSLTRLGLEAKISSWKSIRLGVLSRLKDQSLYKNLLERLPLTLLFIVLALFVIVTAG